MTNNPTIDGVSRELVECDACPTSGGCVKTCMKAAPAVEPASDLREHCKQCAEVVKTWPEWKQSCLGGAPVVERQPVYEQRYGGGWINIGREEYERCLADPEEASSLRIVFTAAPEVAALQSTITQLQARVAELESGRGEPVCYQARHSTEEPWFFTDKPGYWEWRPLFTATGAGGAVLPERRPEIDSEDPALLMAVATWNACLDATAALNSSTCCGSCPAGCVIHAAEGGRK